MTVNTQFPVIEEYARVFPHDNGEKVVNVIFYPMCCFRVPTEELFAITQKVLKEVNQGFDETRPDYMRSWVNHRINQELAKLDESGILIQAEDSYAMPPAQYIVLCNGAAVVTTCDGYTMFNPAMIPPTPSEHMH